jgi:hypothetical protein
MYFYSLLEGGTIDPALKPSLLQFPNCGYAGRDESRPYKSNQILRRKGILQKSCYGEIMSKMD